MSQVSDLPGFTVLGKCTHDEEQFFIEGDYQPACADCGMILSTVDCPVCNRSYLRWGGGSDDVVSGAYASSSGDGPFCRSCYLSYEEEEVSDDEPEFYHEGDLEVPA